jgi:anti-sigma factor RsiW
MSEQPTTEDEMIAAVSDYLDGSLPEAKRAEVASKIANDAEWKRVHGELRETRDALSGLHKARAPETFTDDVTGTIHKRSAGRFFARRTLGDRVPFGVLFAIAIVVLIALGYVMWSSQTGSLKVDPKIEDKPGSARVVP